MGKLSTPLRAGAAGLLLLGACCTSGADPDPGKVRRELAQSGRLANQQEPRLIAESVDLGLPAAPAPIGESARQLLPSRGQLRVAVDLQASEAMDAGLAASLASELGLATAAQLYVEREALAALTVGAADCAIYSGSLSARDLHAGMQQQRIGAELFALVIAADSPVRSLTRNQMRQLLAGEAHDWQQLGYPAAPITTVVPAETALAERAARALIPGDSFAPRSLRQQDHQQLLAQARHHRGAVAVVRITAATPELPPELRYLMVDWMAPTPAMFRSGSYPFGHPIQLVTVGHPRGEAQQLLQYLASPAGKAQLARHLVEP